MLINQGFFVRHWGTQARSTLKIKQIGFFFTVEYKFESRFYLLPAQNTNDAILRRLVRIKKPYVTTFLAHTIKFF